MASTRRRPCASCGSRFRFWLAAIRRELPIALRALRELKLRTGDMPGNCPNRALKWSVALLPAIDIQNCGDPWIPG